MAKVIPDALAIAEPIRHSPSGTADYRQITFRELDVDSNQLANGLRDLGVEPGVRIALLVRPSINFISLVFALFKAGAVTILIDPGMGRRNLIRCLEEAEPAGFVAIPPVHAVRVLLRRKFSGAKLNVTVGTRWFWGGPTLDDFRAHASHSFDSMEAKPQDPAAIIFTTGSTGPPKGVLYSHGNFDMQVTELRDFYRIRPGEIDLPCFPLFGLFNCAMGVSTIIPDMDPTRPAQVDPPRLLRAMEDWQVTQSFASPAVWNRVGSYCEEHKITIPSLRRALSAGAPVPAHVLARMKKAISVEGEIFTPYGATEALPVASISASEVLSDTQPRTAAGAGVCVGEKFPGISWKVIRIVDGPIANIQETEELPSNQIGELIVSGPVVTQRYVTRVDSNRLAKITDRNSFWHRMGDVGYLDARDRFWFCGRLAHRVTTSEGPMYTIPCEALLNNHPHVYRSALVGVGPVGSQTPVLIVEPKQGCFPSTPNARASLLDSLREIAASNTLTSKIQHFLVHPSFPVDIRHNAKIFREKLAVWAAETLRREAK